MERGAEAAVRVDRPRDELAAAIAAVGPYDLVVDYLWGPPAEAAFAALGRGGPGGRIRYVLVGMTAGPEAALPAMALRRARVLLFGSGIGGEAPLAEAAAAYDRVLALAAAGQVTLDVDACRSPTSRRPGRGRAATGASSSCPSRAGPCCPAPA